VSSEVVLRWARASDADGLTAIALRAKAHWGYSAELLALWRDELTITPEKIAASAVLVAERSGTLVGMAAIAGDGEEVELADLWVDPDAMGSGIGRRLFERALAVARDRGALRVVLDADPNAEDFYLHLGARRIGMVASQPVGRELPRMLVELGLPPLSARPGRPRPGS